MQQLNKEELIEAYQEAFDAIPPEALELDLRVTVRAMQALAEGKPVSPDQLAKVWEMPLEQVRMVLDPAVTGGRAVIDAQGDLVGGVLSLVPTAHRISVHDKQIYAWCAYDAIYAPGVIGKPAQVVSRDPVTGDPIRMTITPAGVEKVRPEGAVVTNRRRPRGRYAGRSRESKMQPDALLWITGFRREMATGPRRRVNSDGGRSLRDREAIPNRASQAARAGLRGQPDNSFWALARALVE